MYVFILWRVSEDEKERKIVATIRTEKNAITSAIACCEGGPVERIEGRRFPYGMGGGQLLIRTYRADNVRFEVTRHVVMDA